MPKPRFIALVIFAVFLLHVRAVAAVEGELEVQFSGVREILRSFCMDCHSTKEQQGELDLERFSTLQQVRADLKPWQAMIQQLETLEMPPKDQPQPSDHDRKQLVGWVKLMLNIESRRRSGERGKVPLHRLSNTEYDNTVRDLTGIDLRPAKDFPVDGAAGEGFTNAAEALSMSPAMMAKYVNAAKKIADHAVLLPNGFRFSQYSTRRDWTDESLAALRAFYGQFTADGKLPLKPYLTTLMRNRSDLNSGKVTLGQLAEQDRLSPQYLTSLWNGLHHSDASYPLDRVREMWQQSNQTSDGDGAVDAIMDEVSRWSDRLWEFPKIGSYVNSHRQRGKEPAFAQSRTLAFGFDPVPGQSDVVVQLAAHQRGGPAVNVVWENPRFIAGDRPTLALRDYQEFGGQFEVDLAALFANTESYLRGVVDSAFDPSMSHQQLAIKYDVHPLLMERWIRVAGFDPESASEKVPGRVVADVELQLLNESSPNPNEPAVGGWRFKGSDLPIVVSNSSDQTLNIPGRLLPHSVAVHPTPIEFVAVVWTSPVSGRVRVHGAVNDADSNCGNGVAWRIEKKSVTRSVVVAEGNVDLGMSHKVEPMELDVIVGDQLLLAVGARDNNHVCDLTEVAFTIAMIGQPDRIWDLADDVADNIQSGNPHADGDGARGVWRFVKGPSSARVDSSPNSLEDTLLFQWQSAAAKPDRRDEAERLAGQIKRLLIGDRPGQDDPNRALFDHLVSVSGPLVKGLDLAGLNISSRDRANLDDLVAEIRSGENSFVTASDQVTQLRLPAALLRDYQFVVDCRLAMPHNDGAVQFQLTTLSTPADNGWTDTEPVVVGAEGNGRQQLIDGLGRFRQLFPPFVCYPHVIPVDEVVCLKTFHREDEPLRTLFLDDGQTAQLERLWAEHRFITKFPLVENEYLPLFIGFVTQDQPKETLELFEGKRPMFQRWADEFENDFNEAATAQMAQLLTLAERAYRRPLATSDRNRLTSLYAMLRAKEVSHEPALRSVVASVFMSPSFLMHLEQANGKETGVVNDWELASRISYFLWASSPDDELWELARSGQLHQPDVLAEQTKRMLQDGRVRSLAIEFGTQWIHVRGFDRYDGKNETLFPMFESLRGPMYQEAVLMFEDFFGNNGTVAELLDADHTFLNEALAKHYGIDGVIGSRWRRVDGVKRHGRGGVLGLASVQSKQAGASRTSPILRGNWVVETLLGEKLPLPPPNVPQLPESEIGNGGLTMREITQMHVSDRQCAGCHQRIDPYGLAFEHFDAIGRRRDADLGGLPVDASAELRDGTKFEGIDGLRSYLMTEKKQTIASLFYQRLLGYALKRSVSISDQELLDHLIRITEHGDSGVTDAVVAIIQSRQFRGVNASSVESVTGDPVGDQKKNEANNEASK